MSLYHIHFVPEGEKFRLCNHGVTCGPRLVKSEPFPFVAPQWWMCSSREQAQVAVEKLQKYLDAYEGGLP